jgi:hypothetical protein
MMEHFNGGGITSIGTIPALKLSVAAATSLNLTAVGVAPTDVAGERAKLVAAAQFYATNKPVVDLSYDGIFYR